MTAWVDDGWTDGLSRTSPQVDRIPQNGQSTLELLMADLEAHSDALDAALVEEEKAEQAFNFAESVAMIEYADKVAATILPKYVRAQCQAELAALTSAKFATKRARARVSQTTTTIVAEQSNMKWSHV